MIDFALLHDLLANQDSTRKSSYALEQYLYTHAAELVRLAEIGAGMDGDDQLAELDINDCLQSHADARNYMTRAG